MANVVSDLFNKIKMAQVEKQLKQQEKQDLINSVNQVSFMNGGTNSSNNQIATPQQAQELARQIQGINDGTFKPDMSLIANESNNNTYKRQPVSGLMNKILGVPVTAQTQSTIAGDSQNPEISIGIANQNRYGGILPDIVNGAKENFENKFDISNLQNNQLDDGRQKGFAYRLGEGLGSIGRFMESPTGRALITAGLIGATGGSGLQALTYGAKAGGTNRTLRNEDAIYRNEILQNRIQSIKNDPTLSDEDRIALLNSVSNDVKKLNGYITDDVYNNFIRSQQLRDNADYRNLMLDYQRMNNEENRKLREAQLKQQKEQQEFNQYIQEANLEEKRAGRQANNYYRSAELGLKQQELDHKLKNPSASDRKAMQQEKQAKSTINMVDKAMKTVKKNKGAFGLKGGLNASVINRIDPQGVKARSIVNSVTAEYRKYLTGAQMSDQERKEYYKFLPSPTDNAEIIKSKLKSMKEVISAREGLDTGLSVDMDAVNRELKRRGY